MKRREFIRELESHGCTLGRSGGKHDIYRSSSGDIAAVPRHTEIKDTTCQAIRKQLGIPRR